MPKSLEQLHNEVLKAIDNLTSPDVCTKEEAIIWLEEVQADVDGRIECLKEEMAE